MRIVFVLALVFLTACRGDQSPWRLALSHDANGAVIEGDAAHLVSAIRHGCDIRVAWGARGRANPDRTIEHVSTPIWVSVRNDTDVEVQLDAFAINLAVLGEPPADHENLEPYGGVERMVKWRATLKTDGTFDAVWYYPHNGAFVARVPQRHPMRWFVNCAPGPATPLYPPKPVS
ncbi:MAG: hypothetical protein AAGA09_07035 [Pseudomonadota bacterium]